MVVLAAVVVVLDLLVKRLVTDAIGPDADRHAWWLVGDDIGLEYVRNTGAAFGLLQGNAELLGLVSILVAVGFVAVILVEVRHPLVAAVSGGLIVGGAAGNLVERTVDGFVTDYIAVGPWPRFNIADSAITIGVAIFVAGIVFQPESDVEREGARGDDAARRGGDVERDRSA